MLYSTYLYSHGRPIPVGSRETAQRVQACTSPGTSVSSNINTDRHVITEILLTATLNNINLSPK